MSQTYQGQQYPPQQYPPQQGYQPPQQPASPGIAPPVAERADAKPKARDKAHDAQLALALLLTDYLHGDRHHQIELMDLAFDLLTDLGDEGAAAKERLVSATTGLKPERLTTG
jgi:hypothetical protein